MKCQALYRNSVKTRCHPLVTGWKCTYITATYWESSSTSGKNPSKINLQLMNFDEIFCWTITSINMLSQINVKVFISRHKIFWLPKSIFKAVMDTLRTVFFLVFFWSKNIQRNGEQHLLIDFFPHSLGLWMHLGNQQELLWPWAQCLLSALELLATSSREIVWAEYSTWGIPTYCTVHYY